MHIKIADAVIPGKGFIDSWPMIGKPMTPGAERGYLITPAESARITADYDKLFKRKDGTDVRDGVKPSDPRYHYEWATEAQRAEFAEAAE